MLRAGAPVSDPVRPEGAPNSRSARTCVASTLRAGARRSGAWRAGPELRGAVLPKGTEYRWDFLHDHTKTQAARAEFGVQCGVGIRRAGEDPLDFRCPAGESFGMRMARVGPVTSQPGAKLRPAPKEPPVFEFGIFLEVDAVDKHEAV